MEVRDEGAKHCPLITSFDACQDPDVPPRSLDLMPTAQGETPFESSSYAEASSEKHVAGTPQQVAMLPQQQGETWHVYSAKAADGSFLCEASMPRASINYLFDYCNPHQVRCGAAPPLVSLQVDDRGGSLPGTVEHMWRSVLTACVAPDMGGQSSSQGDATDKQQADDTQCRRPGTVMVTLTLILTLITTGTVMFGISFRRCARCSIPSYTTASGPCWPASG